MPPPPSPLPALTGSIHSPRTSSWEQSRRAAFFVLKGFATASFFYDYNMMKFQTTCVIVFRGCWIFLESPGLGYPQPIAYSNNWGVLADVEVQKKKIPTNAYLHLISSGQNMNEVEEIGPKSSRALNIRSGIFSGVKSLWLNVNETDGFF